MKNQETEIKKGIKLHEIPTNKFKTNLVAIFLTTKLDREQITKNAMIAAILRRGSQTMPTQEEISKQMEEMYGASFDCGLDKTGDNQVLKFYLEMLNDQFLPDSSESILKMGIEKILEIVLNPYLENEEFKAEYVEQEKNNMKQRIEGKKDDKARYALERVIEEMYQGKPFGFYKYGYAEDLEAMDGKNLYQAYQELIATCKIDIFVSGMLDEKTKNLVTENQEIKKLQEREPKYEMTNQFEQEKIEQENIVTESMEVSQGKLVLGLKMAITKEEQRYDALLYNSILGGSANSKIFQNVREKANLAYVASSSYLRHKNTIFINCGIEIGNYEKALEVIRKQLQDMKDGNFEEEEIENAKKGIIATIKTIDDEQDTAISYDFGQELSQTKVTVEEYEEKVQKVTKEAIVKLANLVTIHTIYFLKD